MTESRPLLMERGGGFAATRGCCEDVLRRSNLWPSGSRKAKSLWDKRWMLLLKLVSHLPQADKSRIKRVSCYKTFNHSYPPHLCFQVLISNGGNKRRRERQEFQKGHYRLWWDQEAKTSLGMSRQEKRKSYKETDFVQSGISGSLKFYVCVWKREWKNGGRCRGVCRYYYLCLEEKSFQREVKGSIPSCYLSISSFCCKWQRICRKQRAMQSSRRQQLWSSIRKGSFELDLRNLQPWLCTLYQEDSIGN